MLGALKATGSSDPDVLFAAKEAVDTAFETIARTKGEALAIVAAERTTSIAPAPEFRACLRRLYDRASVSKR